MEFSILNQKVSLFKIPFFWMQHEEPDASIPQGIGMRCPCAVEVGR